MACSLPDGDDIDVNDPVDDRIVMRSFGNVDRSG
jgi:hypothetical protein